MARLFSSNCRRASLPALMLLAAVAVAGCAGSPDRGDPDRWPPDDPGAAAPYLYVLRDYLGQPAGAQAAYRDRLRAAADEGSRVARLKYALALSVDRDDRASLQNAREYFENLLAAPDPLPVALDALVRLQLGQVVDRLERMRAAGDIHEAYRAAAEGQQMCFANLRDSETKREEMRLQLADVRRKLDALARIEQTVNQNQETQDSQRLPPPDDDPENEQERNNDAEPPPDSARR